MGASDVSDFLLAREEGDRETLSRIGRSIGYGRAQQILGELWDEMLQESYGSPPGRGGMGVTVDDDLPPIPRAATTRRSQRSHGGYEMVPAYSVSELKAFGHASIAKAKGETP